MSYKIYFVVENNGIDRLKWLISEFLNNYIITVGTEFPQKPDEFQMIVLWNLRRIIRELPQIRNTVVFHSSDLPHGRGWAPIYYSLAENRSKHVVTAILAGHEVDAGEIIAKASFEISPCYVAETLRDVDEKICMKMIIEILDRYKFNPINSVAQKGVPTFYNRRLPSDSEIDIRKPLENLVPHIRGCGTENPAYFYWNGCRFKINLVPEEQPKFPNDLKIEFADASDSA